MVNNESYELKYSNLLTDAKGQKLVAIVESDGDEVKKILIANKDVLEGITVSLVEKKESFKSDIVRIIKKR